MFLVAERPQHMLMRVSVGIHEQDIEAAIEVSMSVDKFVFPDKMGFIGYHRDLFSHFSIETLRPFMKMSFSKVRLSGFGLTRVFNFGYQGPVVRN